jgi:hypothetical protein
VLSRKILWWGEDFLIHDHTSAHHEECSVYKVGFGVRTTIAEAYQGMLFTYENHIYKVTIILQDGHKTSK